MRLIHLTLLLVTAAQLRAQTAQLKVSYTLDTLPNGLTLIVHEDHSVPIVTTNVWYHVGSGDEKKGRTGFAHLFEHVMFMGSENAPYPTFDTGLEAAGANNNGSTNTDRTNYFEWGPANSLPLMLWLEADRMGWLLPVMTQEKLDLQRDVVKNERRQSVENQPYGIATDILSAALYPATHPYSWPVIGSMADLSAASLEDVKAFFRTYYAPNNATIVVAGAVKADSVKRHVMQLFSDIPRGPAITRPKAPEFAVKDTFIVAEDRVQLPRMYLSWHGVQKFHADDAPLDAAAYLLSGARNSRLTNTLVYEKELTGDVIAFHSGKQLDGDFTIRATARPGKSLDSALAVVDREIRRLATDGPTPRELEQGKNAIESQFLNQLEFVRAKADQLNAYYYLAGEPDYFQKDLDRYRAVTAEDVKRVVQKYLLEPRVTLSIVPLGRKEIGITKRETVQ
ncbi:MAG: M16 family metallopeptidase [Gemmatimonadaceae bacterium]